MIIHIDSNDDFWVRTPPGTMLSKLQHRRCDAYDEVCYEVQPYNKKLVHALELTKGD